MKSKKAFIKLDGKISEKEQSAIEYVDTDYTINQQKQLDEFNELLSKANAQEIIIKKNKKNIERHLKR